MEEQSVPQTTHSSHDITWYLDLRSTYRQEQLVAFKYSHVPPWTMWVFASALTTAFVAFWAAAFMTKQDLFMILLSALSFVAVILPMWYAAVQRNKKGSQASVQIYLESFVALSLVISTALVMAMRLFHGKCSLDLSYPETFSCTPNERYSHIPYDTTIVLLFLPVLCSLGFVSMSWKVVIVSNLLAFVTIIAAAIAFRASHLSAFIFFVILFLTIIQGMFRWLYLELFLYKLRYQSMAELRIQESEEAAGRLANEMQNMVTSISHDTKTPLAAFSCGMDAMNKTVTSFGSQANHRSSIESTKILQAILDIQEILGGLYASYMTLVATVNRCIDFTKACHHIDLVPNLEMTSLREIVEEVLQYCTSLYGASVIEMDQLDPSIIASHIVTDRQWLLDNLLCLCTNAIKYSCKSAVIVTVQHSAECFNCELSRDFREAGTDNGKKYIHFEVWNYGNNMEVSVIDQLFHSPNFHQQRIMGGAGLGLFCLGQRVAALKGCYGVKNIYETEAQGVMFWFDIPYQPSDTVLTREQSISTTQKKIDLTKLVNSLDSTYSSEEERSAGLRANSSLENMSSSEEGNISVKAGVSSDSIEVAEHISIATMKIFVIDDSKAILKMMRMMLEKAGHIVHTATDGSQAVSFLQAPTAEFDLVLIDLQMPVMDGFTAIRAIREDERNAAEDTTEDIKRHLIIAMSANSDHHTVSHAYEAGADYFIPKPFKLDSLHNLLHNHRKRLVQSRSNSSAEDTIS